MMISHSSRFCQISPAITRHSRQSVTVHQVTKGLPKGGEVSSVPGNQVRKLGGSPVIKIDHLTELGFCTSYRHGVLYTKKEKGGFYFPSFGGLRYMHICM